MAYYWADREPEDWEETDGKTARTIERENEIIEELASESETQDEFILEDADAFLWYVRRYYPGAVIEYVRDSYEEFTDWIRENKENEYKEDY